MHETLLIFHSFFRWLVLASLLYAIHRAYQGWFSDRPFSRFDNTIRHTTATIAHIQLILGLWLYTVSPLVQFFLQNYNEAVQDRQTRFFGMEHSTMMLVAIIVITIGSASAKRRGTNKEKFKTMAIWFSIGLFIILINIPWPFSPMSGRPYFRTF